MKKRLRILLIAAGCHTRAVRPVVDRAPVAPNVEPANGSVALTVPPPLHHLPPGESNSAGTKRVDDVVLPLHDWSDVVGELRDAFFDYDRSEPPPEAVEVLRQDAALLLRALADFAQLKITVEGHCAERGSAAY